MIGSRKPRQAKYLRKSNFIHFHTFSACFLFGILDCRAVPAKKKPANAEAKPKPASKKASKGNVRDPSQVPVTVPANNPEADRKLTAMLTACERPVKYPSMILDMSAAEYHARQSEISKHGLDQLTICPAKYKYNLDNPSDPTAAMRIGSLLHLSILEPDEFKATVALQPQDAPRKPSQAQRDAKNPSPETIASITWWDNYYAEVAGKEIVTPDEYEMLTGMGDAVRAHPAAGVLLKKEGWTEACFFWIDPETGAKCRARMDRVIPELRLILDIKTAEEASAAKFSRACGNFRYGVQSAVYPDAAEAVLGDNDWRFIFIVVEKKKPHFVAVYEADEMMRDLGRAEYQLDLVKYSECVASGKWPGYTDLITPISLPAWMANNDDSDDS